MPNLKNLFAVIGLSLLFTACSKDKDDDNGVVTPKKTKTELITAGKWQELEYAYTYAIDGKDTTEITNRNNMDECEKDDYTVFGTDMLYAAEIGTAKCLWSEERKTGFWSFIDSETKLVMKTDKGYSDTAELIDLTDKSMKLKFSYYSEVVNITMQRID